VQPFLPGGLAIFNKEPQMQALIARFKNDPHITGLRSGCGGGGKIIEDYQYLPNSAPLNRP
jgi:hypothetical protein